MGEHKSVIDRFMLKANLENECVPGFPFIEIFGNGRICIENHQGILMYNENMIAVKTKSGNVTIEGCDLLVDSISQHYLVLTGKIWSVTLSEREK